MSADGHGVVGVIRAKLFGGFLVRIDNSGSRPPGILCGKKLMRSIESSP